MTFRAAVGLSAVSAWKDLSHHGLSFWALLLGHAQRGVTYPLLPLSTVGEVRTNSSSPLKANLPREGPVLLGQHLPASVFFLWDHPAFGLGNLLVSSLGSH